MTFRTSIEKAWSFLKESQLAEGRFPDFLAFGEDFSCPTIPELSVFSTSAILLALALGGTPIGAPIVGWVADAFGARWSLGIGVAAGAAALLVGIRYLVRHRGLRVRFEGGRLRITIDRGPLRRPPD